MTKLRVFCCECKACADVSFPEEKLEAKTLYREIGWLLTVVYSFDSTTLLSTLCWPCAKREYPEAVLERAREELSK